MSETRADIVMDIDKMLNSSSSMPSKTSIFRVGDHLRRINPEAYDPEIIAIGPFHRCKPHLQNMQQHKVRYLKLLLQRRQELSLERYVTEIRRLEDMARKCYAEDIGLDEDEFVKMLILDGCFIIEFLRKSFLFRTFEDDPIFQYEHIQFQLLNDLMLFENQIPFFIVDCMFNMSKIDNGDDIKYIIWPLVQPNIFSMKWKDFREFPINGHHFLGILHDIQCSSSKKSEGEELEEAGNSSKKSEGDSFFHGCCSFARSSSKKSKDEELKEAGSSSKKSESVSFFHGRCSFIGSSNKKSEGDGFFLKCSSFTKMLSKMNSGIPGNQDYKTSINSAEELTDSGISFKKLKKAKGLFDIKFENKVLKIPEWQISDETESIFRNLIAYEYYLRGSPQKLVTDYVMFMHCLVNSPEDAKLLRLSGIISNFLGGDEMVYRLINQLHKNIIISRTFSYSGIFNTVNDHCGHKRNRWMAKLRREYFNSPWALISVLVAIILLVLAIMQTTFAILSFRNDFKRN